MKEQSPSNIEWSDGKIVNTQLLSPLDFINSKEQNVLLVNAQVGILPGMSG